MKLEIKNLSVTAEEKNVVNDVSFTMKSGEVHILMGSNGSGKSSLVNALMGHAKYKITSGNIILDEEDITSLSTDKKAKKGLFLSLQHLPEIDGVSFTNFLYRAYKEMKGKDITLLEFNTFVKEEAAKYGLEPTFLRRSVNAGLSGGEKKQSEAFQLAFFEPAFAFLDEIDSGVDIDAVEKIFSVIRTLKEKGTSFLLITHYGKILEKITPDFVHIMKDGKIIKSGGPELAEEISAHGFNNN
ncbi:MAG: Fe-S cluster assembly ATPase SufC [Candidatus Parcubacteria bacterium]|nr:Fe-S cluster assembly ATPase SufC [Candidatus Parcubacteria bacterium]